MGQKFVQKDIVKVCHKIMSMANRAFVKAQYDKALSYIEVLAKINYNFNFIYTDPESENLLSQISSKLIPKKQEFIPITGRLVFYDFFCAGKVLDLQYLRAFMAWDVEFLYIVERNSWNDLQRVLPEIEAYGKAEIFEVEQDLLLTDKIRLIYDKITKYKPEKAFLQLSPWDVVAIVAFHALPQIKRYQIDLTDHAFWLGTQCIDYTIEFRDYGCTVAQEKRGIPKEKILLQPFYPIIDVRDFKGFPEQVTQDKIVIFSGASYYKIYGENGKYFEILKDILDANSSVIILYAGVGDERPLKRFIEKNGYTERIILLGFRSDVNEIFKRCDIYLNTYPVAGGLMSQLAAINSKPILSFSDKMRLLNDADSLVWTNRRHGISNISCVSYKEFLDEGARLINDKEYRLQRGAGLKECMLTVTDFNNDLHNLVTYNKNEIDVCYKSIDYENISNLYLEVDNCFLHTFLLMMGRKFRWSTLYLFPQIAIQMFLYLLQNPRIILRVLRNK